MTTARTLVELIKRHRFATPNEAALQQGLAELFKQHAIEFEREYVLEKFKDIIDFKIGAIGIEVKSGGSRNAVVRQLGRYLRHAELHEVLVVSTRSKLLRLPDRILNKPVHVVALLGGIA